MVGHLFMSAHRAPQMEQISLIKSLNASAGRERPSYPALHSPNLGRLAGSSGGRRGRQFIPPSKPATAPLEEDARRAHCVRWVEMPSGLESIRFVPNLSQATKRNGGSLRLFESGQDIQTPHFKPFLRGNGHAEPELQMSTPTEL